MKKIICLVFMLAWAHAFADVRPTLPMAQCHQFYPFGLPKIENVTWVCREGYVLAFNEQLKMPVWVSYVLDKEKASGCFPRVGGFVKDPSVQNSAKASDYAKSGYDIGHMANDGDMRWSQQTQTESNVFTNAAPQLPSLNRGSWALLEDVTRSWAITRNTTLLIQVGAFKGETTIGKNNDVNVPKAFYKVITDLSSNQVQAFYYTQEDSNKKPNQTKVYVKNLDTPLSLPPKFKESKTIWPLGKNAKKERSVACSLK
jgi:endonuclease G, mitochondrial